MKIRNLCLPLLFLAMAAVSAVAGVQIELKGAAVVPPGEIRLSDVASVKSDDPALSTQASEISLGVTPLPGNARVISREHVLMYVARAGITSTGIEWQGDKACTVTVRSRRVTG